MGYKRTVYIELTCDECGRTEAFKRFSDLDDVEGSLSPHSRRDDDWACLSRERILCPECYEPPCEHVADTGTGQLTWGGGGQPIVAVLCKKCGRVGRAEQAVLVWDSA